MKMHGHSMMNNYLRYAISGALLIFLGLSVYRKVRGPKKLEVDIMQKNKVMIDGMSCQHCVGAVTNAIKSLKGVESVTVSLDDKAAYIEGEFDMDELRKAIENAGYTVVNT
jgi:copper chaperone